MENLGNKIHIWSVSELTNKISLLLYESFGYVYVRGEVSNYKLHSSGHRYFTLKDQSSQIPCVLWRSKVLQNELSDGMEVLVGGRITVYPPRGQYQIECEEIFHIGLGDLYLKFEALKKKLASEGLFNEEFKKPIPQFPLKIGIATSPTGAVIQDMITTIRRRNPLCTIYFRETIVQGEEAKQDIVNAIEELNALQLDVIIIGRGGGSLEDLWAFNEEEVARAIFSSKIPIISAVGHETDFTISDFVADRRAPTPTAAAELVTPITIENLNQKLDNYWSILEKYVLTRLNYLKEVIENIRNSYSFRKIKDLIHLSIKETDELEEKLLSNIKRQISSKNDKLENLSKQLTVLEPMAPLKKGFAFLSHNGRIINNFESLNKFKKIKIIRLNEEVDAKIEKVRQLLFNSSFWV